MNRLANVEYLDKGGFSTVYKAFWLDGPIEAWDYEKDLLTLFLIKIMVIIMFPK